MRFRATVELGGKTATGVEVPQDVVEGLRSGKRPAVRVTINGYTYRSSVGSMGGRFMLGISAEVRTGAGVQAGDEVDIDVELDTEPREVSVPATSPSPWALTSRPAPSSTDSHTAIDDGSCSRSRTPRRRRPDSGALTRRSAPYETDASEALSRGIGSRAKRGKTFIG
jgi:hypothetical protein